MTPRLGLLLMTERASEAGARKRHMALPQDQGPISIPLPTLHQGANADVDYHSRSHSHRSIIQKPSSQNARCVDRDPRGIFHPGSAHSRPRRTVRFVDLLAAGHWAHAPRWSPTGQTHHDVLPSFFKIFVEHQGPRRFLLGCEPAPGRREAGNSTRPRTPDGVGNAGRGGALAETVGLRAGSVRDERSLCLSPCTTGALNTTILYAELGIIKRNSAVITAFPSANNNSE